MIFVCNISGDVCTNVACEFITGDNGALIYDCERLIGDCMYIKIIFFFYKLKNT